MTGINWKGITYWMLTVVSLIILLCAFFPPVSAYPYVYQGDNITQGQVYDLSGVVAYGEHYGEFAYWKDWWQEGGTSTPTIINRIEPRFLYSVCIDNKRWKVGNWYKYNGDKEARNENNFAFRVIQSNITATQCAGAVDPTPVPTAIIYDITGVPTQVTNSATTVIIETPIPVPTTEPTPMGTIQLQSTPTPKKTIKVVAGATPTFPPPRGLPLSPFVGVIGIGFVILIFGRR